MFKIFATGAFTTWATVGGFFSTLTLVVGTVPFTATSLGVPFHSFFYLFEMYI
jgi:hypothetical protein